MIWSNGLDNSIAIAMSKFFDLFPTGLKNLVIAFSSFGDKGVFFICVGILLLFFVKTRKLGLVLLLSTCFTLFVNDLILKNIFDRARPFEDLELVKNLVAVQNNNGVVYGIVPTSSSFPSGHTFTSFAAFGGITSFYIFDKENKKDHLAPMIFFGLFAFAMGFARILLSHHYFTDVLCGAIIGFGLGLTSYIIIKYFYKLIDLIKEKINSKKEVKGE